MSRRREKPFYTKGIIKLTFFRRSKIDRNRTIERLRIADSLAGDRRPRP